MAAAAFLPWLTLSVDVAGITGPGVGVKGVDVAGPFGVGISYGWLMVVVAGLLALAVQGGRFVVPLSVAGAGLAVYAALTASSNSVSVSSGGQPVDPSVLGAHVSTGYGVVVEAVGALVALGAVLALQREAARTTV